MNKRYYVSIEESIYKILRTPLGSRVMRPYYGSKLFDYVDRRLTPDVKIDLVTEIYQALERNEKRIRVKNINFILVDEKFKIEITYFEKENKSEMKYIYEY